MFDLPEWLAQSIVGALVVLAIGLLVGWLGKRNTDAQIAELLAKRGNLSRDEFFTLMAPDVSRDASEFLWEASLDALSFFKPEVTIHPDDHLLDDVPVDEGEWSLDWPGEWADQQGIREKNLPDWPEDWPATIRNFGLWLDLGAVRDD